MTDRVAVITGAARGIGAAVALEAASLGWKLVLFDRCADDAAIPYHLASQSDLDAVVTACGGAAVGFTGDVRDQAALDGAVGLAVERWGGLDAAVAVAGIVGGGPVAWETADELWDAVVGVNLGGVSRLARASIPVMLERAVPREGRFVAVASASAVVGLPQLSAYSAAKHGVVGLVRSMAAELGGKGITANVVAPGSTRTAGLRASADVYGIKDVEDFAVHHLDRRLLEPPEIAAAVMWLCSSAASGVTGAVLPVDAGMTAR